MVHRLEGIAESWPLRHALGLPEAAPRILSAEGWAAVRIAGGKAGRRFCPEGAVPQDCAVARKLCAARGSVRFRGAGTGLQTNARKPPKNFVRPRIQQGLKNVDDVANIGQHLVSLEVLEHGTGWRSFEIMVTTAAG